MIPKTEIDSMAGDIIAGSADPEREAFARHERAGQVWLWLLTNGFNLKRLTRNRVGA